MKTKLFCLLFSFIMALPVSADTAYNWYFKSAGDGSQPTVMDGNTMPDKYGAIYLGDKDDKVIYLTFDAGYGCESLDSILATLKEEEVKATFFILPALIKYARPTVMQMIEDGHLVGNHTKSHANMARLGSKEAVEKELTALEDYYREETGAEMSPYYRPPEGAFSEQSLRFAHELGYTAVFWSFAYADWDNAKQPDPNAALERILKHAHNGEVMLLHPNSATNAALMGDMIRELKARGYRFDTVDNIA